MGKEQDTVIGVFLDQGSAQRAVEQLQAAGFKATLAGQGGRSAYTGISDQEARLYESRANEGNAIVTVQNAGDRGEQAVSIMLEAGAENIDMTAQQSQGADYYRNLAANKRQYGQIDTATGRGKTAEEMRVQLREEVLTPVKQATEAGQVQLRKTVHEKEQQVPVNLVHEEVTIERRPVDRPLQAGELTDLREEVIDVPVYEEQAQLQKQGRVREEVVINKERVQEQQTLGGTTRHEHLEVEQTGDVVRGDVNSNVRTTQTNTETYDQS
jgi:uncharacterized protein (TIGR02271 family)